MKITNVRRTTAGLAVSAAVAAGALLTGAGPALADAQGCGGNTCVYLAGNAGGTALAQGWARTYSFYGHFHLSGPNGISRDSGTGPWYGGKGTYWSTAISNAPRGQYCISGYSNDTGYQGTACETLG